MGNYENLEYQSKYFNRSVRTKRYSRMAGLLLTSMASTVMAQTQEAPSEAASESAEPAKLQEVVVTANRRAETLLKAPVAVSVLSVETLKKTGVVGIQDLNSVVPNTNVRSIGSDNGLQFAVRGVSNSDFNDSANPAVATYIDGVYVGRTQGLAGALYDLERVEVLRGPQGTLYGRNSTGGNVNIMTADPRQKFDASADLSFGNYNDVQMNAMLNVPVTDTLAVRAAFTSHRNDGYFDTLGTTNTNYGKADDYAGRLTMLWRPSDSFKWRLSVDDYISHGTPTYDQVTGPDGKPKNGGSPYKQPAPSIQEPALYVNNLMVRSRMDWSLSDDISLTYIAGYQHVQDKPQTVLVDSPFFRDTPSKTNNQEIVASMDFGRIHNLVGGSYLHQHFFSRGAADFLNTGADTVFMAHGDAITEAWGVFDQLTFDVADNFRLTGGVRYSRETFTEKNSRFTFCPIALYPPATFPVRTLLPQQFSLAGCATIPGLSSGQTDGSVSSSSPTYLARVEYDVSKSSSGYLSVSTGFKAGGLNLGPAVNAADFPFKPEKVINYELGFKTRQLENRLGLNAALFYTKYSDIQVTQLSRIGLSNVTTNAAGARMYGVELEAQYKVGANDRISGFVNYLNAKYSDYRDAVDELTSSTIASLKGNDQPFAAKFSGRVQYVHEMPLADGARVTFTGSVYGQSASYLRAFNLPIDRVPGYSKTDLELAYAFPGDKFTLSSYVHNAEDRAIRNGSYPFLGSYLSAYSPPRTFGVRLAYKY